MNTKFKTENMARELPIDGDEDVVIVLRDRGGVQDYFIHLPPFKGSNKDFPPHIGTAIVIAACLRNEDKEFYEFIGKKFEQYAESYLDRLYPGEVKREEE
jgi:hypothetical protein